MPKRLSEEQVAQYERDGYTFPIDVFTPGEVARFRASLAAVEAAQGGPLKGPQKSKSYLLYDWYYQMITHPNVLDGKYAQIIYRDYVRSAEAPTGLSGIEGSEFIPSE